MQTSDLDVPRFQLSEVAAAVGRDSELVRLWISRGHVVLREEKGDRPAQGQARIRLFTARRVLQIAVMSDLVACGLPPSRASVAAEAFSDDTGPRQVIASRHGFRGPGLPYPSELGDTILIVHGGGSEDDLTSKLAVIRSNIDWRVALFQARGGSATTTAIAVDCGKIFDRTLRALGLDPKVFSRG